MQTQSTESIAKLLDVSVQEVNKLTRANILTKTGTGYPLVESVHLYIRHLRKDKEFLEARARKENALADMAEARAVAAKRDAKTIKWRR